MWRVERVREALAEQPARLRGQACGRGRLDVDGDQATASSNSIVYYYRDGQAPHFTGGLRQYCTAVRTSAGWRIHEVRVTPAWTREN